MTGENVFVTLVLLLISSENTFQQFAGCRKSYYLHEGSCTTCPVRCAACKSDLNCTECKGNHYGPVCQYTCPQDCKDLCHKEHGYCTYGCNDGLFPEPNSSLCADCPPRCKKCKSLTECIECIPGYHGNTCGNRCSSHCEFCNKTTGACLMCDVRYFKQGGQCRECSEGCVNCYSSENCSRCEDGFLKLINGQCIMECSMQTTDNALNTIALEYITSLDCTTTKESQEVEIKTKKPCIQYTPCPSNIMCPSESDRESGCGTLKTYQCSHECHMTKNKNCMFVHNCTITEESLSSMPFCFTNKDAFTGIKRSTESECFNVSKGSSNATPYPRVVLIVVLVIVTVVVVVFVPLVIIRLMKRHHAFREYRRKVVKMIESIECEAISMTLTENEDSNDATIITLHSHANLEKDETSCLNGNGSNDATLDHVLPNSRSCKEDSYPHTRGSQSTEHYRHPSYLDIVASFISLKRYK